MSLTDFMIHVFCLIDDFLGEMTRTRRLRQRGPRPTLSDSEVLTLELVGEFLGLDEDAEILTYFRRHYRAFFPALAEIDRTTFTRQAAKLYRIKAELWKALLGRIEFDELVSIIDSFPVPVCRFARASRCKRLREVSSYGYDEMAKQTYFGLRAHLRVAWPGVIVGFDLAAANVHDLSMVEELSEGARGWMLGDRNYWSPAVHEQQRQQGLSMLTPEKSRRREKKPWPHRLVQMRRRIETVIGQLTERFHAKKVWARDRWHLTSRFLRKIASHTIAVLLCQQQGLSPLRFSELVID